MLCQPQPEPLEAPSSSQTTAETPHAAIPNVKEETSSIEEPDKQAPGLPEEKATLSKILGVLKNLLTSNADQSDRLHAAVEALKQKPEALDIKTAFWNAYKPLADEFDKEFKDKYGTNLDTSLIFAGLFSAVSSAFIIQIQPQLQPDPNVITQGLLLHLVQNITGSVPPGIKAPLADGADSMVIIAQSFLYFSLFSTLLAALLAVLAKQWLLHYDSAGERGSMEDRGLERQRKVDGLQRWKFDFVMQIFPLLLQTSLLLFAAALSIYLWTINNVIAAISIGLTSLGVILYILMVVSAVISRDSPYQTSLSYAATVFKDFKQKNRSFSRGPDESSKLQHRKFWQKLKNLPPLLPRFNSEKSKSATLKPIPMFDELPPPSKEIEAVLWALETSTDPRVVEAVAVMVPSLQWPIDLELQPAMRRLADVFNSCMLDIGTVREGMDARATSCLKAFGVLETISSSSEDTVDPIAFNPYLIEGVGDELAWLIHFYKVPNVMPPWSLYTDVTQSALRFISGRNPPEYNLEKVLDHFNPNGELLKDSSLLADFLFCINSFFSHPARQDLALMDKSYHTKIMEELFDNLANRLTAITCPLNSQVVEKICKKIGLFKHSGLLDPNSSQWRTTAYKFCANPELPWDVKASMMELVRVPTGYIRPVKHIAVDVAWVYTMLEELQSPLTGDTELLCDLLQVLCSVQPVPLKSTIANTLIFAISAVEHDHNSMRRMQQSVFQILCSAFHWFKDNELQPVLREQLVLEKLHNVLMSSLDREYVHNYVNLCGEISYIPLWQNVMRKKLPGWLQLMYSTMAKGYLPDAFFSVSARLWGIDESEMIEYDLQEKPLVLAFNALAKTWNQFIITGPHECHQIATNIRCTVSMAFLSRAGFLPLKDGICVTQPSQNLKDKIMPRLSNALTTAARAIANDPNIAQEMKATMSRAADIMLKVASTISGELTHGWDQQQEANSEEAELRYWENLRMEFDLQLSALEQLVEKMGEEHGPKSTVL